jgi:predicted  nucleic acid-binding Zn-ribbon protein
MKYNPEKAEQTLEFDFSEVSEVINNSAESPLTDAMEKSEKLRNRISAIDSEIEKLQQEKELLSTELKKVLASIQK